MDLLNKTLETISNRSNRTFPALMTHVVLGYPSLNESMDIVKTMADAGADIIELQIPFSDPIADGPTILYANEHSLAGGVTSWDCLKAMEKLQKTVHIPLLFMSYYNILFAYGGGLTRFCRDAARAGTQGLIVPDVPIEDKKERYWEITKQHGLAPIPIASPLSSNTRLKTISHAAGSGFVYCVTATATTGARNKLPTDIGRYLRNVRKHVSQPLAVGFGISKTSHVRALAKYADIAVVGSATIDLIRTTKKSARHRELRRFVRSLTG